MRLHAELRRKQSEIQDENCIVTDIIELPESEYASLYQNLLRERDYLAERVNMESFIDGAIMSGLSMVTIIHGKGTGVLREAIHRRLRTMKQVKSFRVGMYGEGENGVTIVELK